MKYPVALTAFLLTFTFCGAFSVHRGAVKLRRPPHVTVLSEQYEQPKQSCTALRYRVLSKDDDESVMQKLKIRTPPGYKMKDALEKIPKTGVNTSLLQALFLNQALILMLGTVVTAVLLVKFGGLSSLSNLNDILRWTGTGPGIFDLFPTGERLLYGIAGAAPLLILSNLVENSDNRAFSNVNFATIVMTMTLFGRRKAPPDELLPPQLKGGKFPTSSSTDVLIKSLLLSSVVGFCEESVFRRMAPAVLSLINGPDAIPINIAGAAGLFALGHLQPKTGLQENAVVGSFMFVNGLFFGLLYLLSGGDLVPCIIAHALYDFVSFYKTWLDANDQVEYAETKYQLPLSIPEEKEVQAILRSARPRMDPLTFKVIKRLFYTFDFDKNGSLSLSEVRKGISYLAIEKAATPPPQQVVDRLFREVVQRRDSVAAAERDPNRLVFPDFLRLLAIMNTEQKRQATAKTPSLARA